MAFGIVTTDRGDVRELTDASGTPFAFYSYDAYGDPAAKLSQATSLIGADVAAAVCSGNVVRYAGYVYDQESGLYYLSARYYDPSTASFLTKDPADADGEESPYQYCGGNPVGKVDPSGENTVTYTKTGVLFVDGVDYLSPVPICGYVDYCMYISWSLNSRTIGLNFSICYQEYGEIDSTNMYAYCYVSGSTTKHYVKLSAITTPYVAPKGSKVFGAKISTTKGWYSKAVIGMFITLRSVDIPVFSWSGAGISKSNPWRSRR